MGDPDHFRRSVKTKISPGTAAILAAVNGLAMASHEAPPTSVNAKEYVEKATKSAEKAEGWAEQAEKHAKAGRLSKAKYAISRAASEGALAMRASGSGEAWADDLGQRVGAALAKARLAVDGMK